MTPVSEGSALLKGGKRWKLLVFSMEQAICVQPKHTPKAHEKQLLKE